MHRLILLSSSLLVLVACTPADDGPTGGPDAEGNDGSAVDMSMGDAILDEAGQEVEAAAGCNDLLLDAPAVGFTYDLAAPPAPAGGTIADGTYFLTAQVLYQTASGPTLPLGRTKAVIAGANWQEVSGDPEPGSVNPDKRWTHELVATGTSLTLTPTCPSAGHMAQPASDRGGMPGGAMVRHRASHGHTSNLGSACRPRLGAHRTNCSLSQASRS
jgi:hypothetical protein